MFIAVSQRITELEKIGESRDSLDGRLSKLLFDCKFIELGFKKFITNFRYLQGDAINSKIQKSKTRKNR